MRVKIYTFIWRTVDRDLLNRDNFSRKDVYLFPQNPSNARGAKNMGYATPGHVVDEQDFMNAFFNNQDHDAVSVLNVAISYVLEELCVCYRQAHAVANIIITIHLILVIIVTCSLLARRRMRPTEESREMWRTISLTSLGIIPTPLPLRT